MVAAYKKAERYSDHGVLRLAVTVNGEKQERSAPYSIVWERPNKLRMHALSGVVVCDGKQFHAHFLDMGGQLARRPAPAQLTIPDLLSDTIFDSAISEGGPSQFSLIPPQVLLLLAKDPLKTIRYRSKEPTLLTPDKIGEDECYRVQLDRPDGKAVLWIDRENFDPAADRVSHRADEGGCRRREGGDPFVEGRFPGCPTRRLDRPGPVPDRRPGVDSGRGIPHAGAAAGSRQAYAGLPLRRPERQAGRSRGPEGKVAVLEFWATFCGPCRLTMPLLEKVYQKYKANPNVVFLAVSVDEKTAEDKDVQATLAEWQATLPIVAGPGSGRGHEVRHPADPGDVPRRRERDGAGLRRGIPAVAGYGPGGKDREAPGRPGHFPGAASPLGRRPQGRRRCDGSLGQSGLVRPLGDRSAGGPRDQDRRAHETQDAHADAALEVPRRD